MTEIDPIENFQRRKFIRQTALTGAGLVLAPAFISFSQTNSESLNILRIKSDRSGFSEPTEYQNDDINDLNQLENSSKKITIQSGGKSFTATLLDNEAAIKFYSLLPMSVVMSDLNKNEKYYRLPENLPTKPFNPGTIQTGDLLLWGSDTFVIFYESFPTSYSYTRLGKIDDPAGLKEALGAGNSTVKIESSK